MSGWRMARDGVLLAVVGIASGWVIGRVTHSDGWRDVAIGVVGMSLFAGATLVVIGLVVGLVQVSAGTSARHDT